MSQPRILIIRTDRVGDVVLSTPVVRALRAAYPEGYLAMMVRPGNRELVEGNPDLNAVFLYDKDGPEKSWAGTLRFARRLKAEKFDTALILHSTNRVIWTSWLAGIPSRLGYARRLPWLLTDRLPYVKPEGDRHELEYNLDLLRSIGIEPKEKALFIPTTPAQEEKVNAYLRQHQVDANRPIVVLHPGASCPSKRWPVERFAALGDQLAQRHQATVLVMTGPGEIPQGEAVLRKMGQKAVPVLGVFSLGETACLLRKSRCLVSNDSGPVHLAGAMRTPVVSIFGRWGGGLSPRRWGPTGPNSAVLHRDIGCRPCLAHDCTIGFECLNAISVDEVVSRDESNSPINGS